MADQAFAALPLEENSGGYKTFHEYLQKREFFHIHKSAVVPVSDELLPTSPTSQPPVVSDQGSDPTCSSHAMGKCITAIVDDFGLGQDYEILDKNLIFISL